MTKLALLRHGQSEWNLQNRFTGWVDIPLTEQGRAEAAKAGTLLKECGAEFVHAYTSVISRAIITLNLAQEEMGETWMPVTKDYRLNERHYGGLTGLNKAETAKIHGDAQVKIWRRSYDTPPPLLEDSSEFPSLADRRYAGLEVPKAESLKLTLERVEPYWENVLAPRLCAGENLIIARPWQFSAGVSEVAAGCLCQGYCRGRISHRQPALARLEAGQHQGQSGSLFRRGPGVGNPEN